MAPSSNEIRFMVARYSFGLNLFPDGDTSIKRLIKPDFASVILTGFSRGSFYELEKQKSKIINHYRHSVSVVTKKGSAMVIFYDNSFNIPLEDDDLKKCQITLNIKLWKGN